MMSPRLSGGGARWQRAAARIIPDDAYAGGRSGKQHASAWCLFGLDGYAVYRKVALHDATAASIYHEMMDFGQLAATLLAKRGIGLPEVMLHDDRDIV